jgi:hypothetical protein
VNINSNTKFLKRGVFPLFLFVFLLFSCKEETSNVGIDLLDSEMGANAKTLTLNQFSVKSIAMDSVVTSSLDGVLLGAQNDPIFGKTVAESVLQPVLVSSGYIFEGATLDSIVLVLPFLRDQTTLDNMGGTVPIGYSLFYGDLSSNMNMDVYTIDKVLDNQKLYYNNTEIPLENKVGSFNGSIDWNRGVTNLFNGVETNEPPQIRIRLDDAFGQSFIDQGSSTYSSQSAFQEFIKGLCIVPKVDDLNLGDGAFVVLQTASNFARLELYYQQNTPQRAVFRFPSNSVTFSRFNVEESNNVINQWNAPENEHFDQVYLQYMSSRVKLNIPSLQDFIDTVGDVMIHEAKLKLKVLENSQSDFFQPPLRLNITKRDEVSGKEFDVLDRFTRNTSLGGFYNRGSYEFYINRELQYYVNEKVNNNINLFNGFYITIPNSFPLVPSRLVLDTDNNLQAVELFIRYTKL